MNMNTALLLAALAALFFVATTPEVLFPNLTRKIRRGIITALHANSPLNAYALQHDALVCAGARWWHFPFSYWISVKVIQELLDNKAICLLPQQEARQWYTKLYDREQLLMGGVFRLNTPSPQLDQHTLPSS